jgi:hypothetical protein
MRDDSPLALALDVLGTLLVIAIAGFILVFVL